MVIILYNAYIYTDLVAREVFHDSGVEVGLSWEKIYLEKKGPMEEKVKVKALHVDIKSICHQQNFTTLSNKYSISETGFLGGRKMRLFPVKNKTNIQHSKKQLTKSVLRQKSFLEVIQSDTKTYILTLYIKTCEINSLWVIISKLTSTKYPNLHLLLSVGKTLMVITRLSLSVHYTHGIVGNHDDA